MRVPRAPYAAMGIKSVCTMSSSSGSWHTAGWSEAWNANACKQPCFEHGFAFRRSEIFVNAKRILPRVRSRSCGSKLKVPQHPFMILAKDGKQLCTSVSYATSAILMENRGYEKSHLVSPQTQPHPVSVSSELRGSECLHDVEALMWVHLRSSANHDHSRHLGPSRPTSSTRQHTQPCSKVQDLFVLV